ncbi:MAG: DNA translocase FtsK 4TM domain-containing protein [Kiritimatiellae bacterium]|nr:DNA translocase FtsK 4TM domain-containing protein [Kiritimatiellia bacterium]
MAEFSTDNVQDRLELERRVVRRLVGLLLFPIALFPLLSLVTYDWRDISWLHSPPLDPTANLIGIVGAWSVFIGYSLIGLALWVVPFLVLFFSGMLIYGRILRTGRRAFWMLLFMAALCCLLQLGSAGVFDGTLERLNLKPNAGGAVGYWLMTCLLARWFSPVGGGILMLSIMAFALVMAVGLRNLFAALGRLTGWWESRQAAGEAPDRPDEVAAGRPPAAADDGMTQRERERQQRQLIREAARRAKEEARKAREEERQRDNGGEGREAAVSGAAQPFRVPAASVPPVAEPQPPPVRKRAAPPPEVEDEKASGLADYMLPPLTLLNPIPKGTADHGNISETSAVLVETLRQFNVPVEVVGTTPGPVVTQYELRPAPNIKVERIASLTANLQMALEATSLRVQAPIPGKNAVGVEIPNRRARPVTFREVIEGEAWRRCSCEVPLLLGKDVAGNDLIFDLTKAPHLLVAGATGSGKSVCLNAILNGFLMSRTPQQLRLILVDPKRVEFTCYNDLPHLLVPVVNDPKKVAFGLRWAIMEMEKRYRLLQKVGCRNIVAYNNRLIATQEELFGEDAPPVSQGAPEDTPERLPYIVIVVDEVADIMLAVGKEVEPAIARLTSLSRAVGIHLILATQRPSVDVITGTIKSNIPGRIAFKVSQSNDSRTILDSTGAEELIGKGDMLFLREGSQLMRAQGAWVSDEEIARVVSFVKEHSRPCYDLGLSGRLEKIKESDPEAEMDGDEGADEGGGDAAEEGVTDDALLPNALEVVRLTRRASTTMLQRRLRIGYTRAARLMDILEERGVVGPQVGSGTREILVDLDKEIPVNGAGGAETLLPGGDADTDDSERL